MPILSPQYAEMQGFEQALPIADQMKQRQQAIASQNLRNQLLQTQAKFAPQQAQLNLQQQQEAYSQAQQLDPIKLESARTQLKAAEQAVSENPKSAAANVGVANARANLMNAEATAASHKALASPGAGSTVFEKAVYDHNLAVQTFGPDSTEAASTLKNAQNITGSPTESANMTAAQKALAVKEGTDYGALQTTASENADKGDNVIDNVNGFVHSYNQLSPLERGPGLGYFSALTPTGQLVRKAQNRLALAMLSMQKFGRVTNKEMNIVQNSTLNTHMLPGAVAKLAPQLKIIAQLQQQYPPFLTKLQQEGVTRPAVANSLWHSFINQRPVINENSNVHPENLTNWSDYTTPQAIQAVKAGKLFSPEAESNNPGISGEQSFPASDGNLYTHTQVTAAHQGKEIGTGKSALSQTSSLPAIRIVDGVKYALASDGKYYSAQQLAKLRKEKK